MRKRILQIMKGTSWKLRVNQNYPQTRENWLHLILTFSWHRNRDVRALLDTVSDVKVLLFQELTILFEIKCRDTCLALLKNVLKMSKKFKNSAMIMVSM